MNAVREADKTCAKCGETKSITEFCRDNRRKDGRSNICKPCDTEKYRKYYERNREKVNARRRASYAEHVQKAPRKICTKCYEDKPATQFYKDSQKKDGLSPVCKTCKNQEKSGTVPAGAKRQRENRRRYLEVVSQLNDAATDREPKKHECNYSGCKNKKAYKNDPHRLGFCAKHEKNAARILGYKQTTT